VYMDGRLSGLLEQSSAKEYRFTYKEEALPISLTMPVRSAPYIAPYLFPVFQVSLPEGPLRAIIERDMLKRIHASGDMAILSVVGCYLIGAITVVPEGGSCERAPLMADIPSVLRHGVDSSHFVIDLLRLYAQRSGVSGGYPKILANESSLQGTLTTRDWIVKMPDADHPDIAINELFSMQAAQEAGIETAETRLSDDGHLLLIKRFDRDQKGNALAFEDMASLMGLPSSAKFSGSVERIVKTLTTFCEGPARSRALEQFFRQYTLAMLLRNGDAHLKNFGVLYRPKGEVHLAPCYDMVTMAAYAPITPAGHTQDIPAIMWRNTKRWPQRRDLDLMAKLCGIHHVDIVLREIANGVHAAARSLTGYLRDHPDNQERAERILILWRDGLEQAGLLRETDFPTET